MYKARTHIMVIGLMVAFIANYYGQDTIGASAIFITFLLLHVV